MIKEVGGKYYEVEETVIQTFRASFPKGSMSEEEFMEILEGMLVVLRGKDVTWHVEADHSMREMKVVIRSELPG